MRGERVVVLGGGLGGLAVALRLAVQGFAVTVCERNERLGGKMGLFERDGFRFDTGPSLLTLPSVFAELFAAAGARLEDCVEWIKLDPAAEYVYPDGTRFLYTTNLAAWLETLARLDPREPAAFRRFLALGGRLFALSRETFLRRAPSEPPDRRTLAALRRLPLRNAWGSYGAAVRRLFHTEQLVRLFERYPTYVGSAPDRSPAMLLVIPYLEYAYGSWYVRGGLYRIVAALASLLVARGVELRMGAEVVAIERAGGRVDGVRLSSGERLPASVVVMNGDASDLPRLLGEGPGGLAPEERSLSGLVFLWGLRRERPDLAHHTVFFSADYEREFRQLFAERRFPDDPTVYVNAASRSDRSLVPEGRGETLFVMANAPAEPGPWHPAGIASARERVLARLAAGGFAIPAADLVVEEVWTPRRFAETYLAPGGAIYGTHSHGWRRAFLRPANRQRRVPGLYLVGGSTHPGGGTPTVLMSARLTAELILKDRR